ncbi:hypothetical protein M8818_005126 [Zalaria obscura]|uniref:Uncharacterized protein n=1 Tax=Zalaria obscura TaxID=2024903 RepID=A0ACC3SAS7_9PEZI
MEKRREIWDRCGIECLVSSLACLVDAETVRGETWGASAGGKVPSQRSARAASAAGAANRSGMGPGRHCSSRFSCLPAGVTAA